MILRDYQRRALDELYQWLGSNEGHPCLVLPTGCHAKGQLIFMFDGTLKPVEQVKVGDLLMGPNSLPRKVLNLHRGTDEMFLVTPHRGSEPFTVNGGHILSLVSTNEGGGHKKLTGNEVENISVRDYLKKAKYWKHTRKLYRASVELPSAKLPSSLFGDIDIPPYILGLILGDGCVQNRSLSLTTMDPEIENEFISFVESRGQHVRVGQKEGNRAKSFNVSGNGDNTILKSLYAMGVTGKSGDKFVPEPYRVNSQSIQLEVLAGLIDTDGSLSRAGFDYITKSKRLADDVAFMARCCGITAHISECKKGYPGFVGNYFRVSLSGDCSVVPCRLPRKKAKKPTIKKRSNVTGFTVESVGAGEYFGFEVDGDHLYLMGDTTVTHNSGKSVIIASMCREFLSFAPESKILMLTHVRELIEQNAAKMCTIWPNAPLGIYSAGLRRKELGEPITFGGIQSLRGKADEIGHVDVAIIDECHLVSHEDEGGYRDLLNELTNINPRLRIVGLTASPWRLGHGLITEKPAIFDDLIEPVSVEELIARGFLANLRSKNTEVHYDLSKVHKRGGEYIESELAKAVDTSEQNERVADEIIARAGDRKAWLVFCVSVEHAEHMRDAFLRHGILSAVVTGDTPSGERARILEAYKRGQLRCVCNVNVLSTGFDYPDIDLVAMLRPTLSPSLYYQQVGRGLRLKSHTDHCLILDFAGNIETHGPITNIREPKKAGQKEGDPPVKTCENCGELVPLSARVCPDCGTEFPPPPEKKAELRDDDIMGKDLSKTRRVIDWTVRVHRKPEKPEMLRIDYVLDDTRDRVSEYLCLRHGGYAQVKGERLLADIGRATGYNLDPSLTLDSIVKLLENAEPPSVVTYEKEGEFFRVKSRKWEQKESAAQIEAEDDIPF